MNADVVQGPGSNGASAPIDGDKFIEQVKKLNSNIVLSVGWATDVRRVDGYSISDIEAMAKMIERNRVFASDHKPMTINFPVRAVNAMQSQDLLHELYNGVNGINPVTFTVQAAKGDDVDATELQKFIKTYGVERVYIDLPDELRNELNLGKTGKTGGAGGGGGASSIAQFSLLNLVALAIVTVLRN